MTKLVTVTEAAELLQVKPATIRSWIYQRKIAYVKLSRCVRIPAEVLEAVIASNVITPREPLGSNGKCEDDDD